MNDVIGALRDWLAAQTAITDLVGTRIYVNRLPRDVIEGEDTFRPQKMLVIAQSGGGGRSDFQPLDSPSVDVICYGESDFEADKIRREVWDAFRLLNRVRQGSVLIHHVNASGGAIPSIDPDIVWPAVAQSYTTLAATET